MTRSLAVVLVALFPILTAADEIVGPVVAVADDDTLTVLQARTQVRIRLTEIDAPERPQPFGRRSRQSLSELCFRKTAEVASTGEDRYGRTLGRVRCDGKDANAEQVARGMAWVYDRYVTDKGLYELQDAARQTRVGLWSDSTAIPPWQWRRKRKE